MKRLCFVLALSFLLASAAGAHPGKTDAAGGHTDSATGEYHYHHGYEAHQHPGGVCPYDYHDATDHTSTSSDYDPFSDSSTDSTYENAYLSGCLYKLVEVADSGLYESYEYMLIDTYMEEADAHDGDTPLSDMGLTIGEAFTEGYQIMELTAELISATASMDEEAAYNAALSDEETAHELLQAQSDLRIASDNYTDLESRYDALASDYAALTEEYTRTFWIGSGLIAALVVLFVLAYRSMMQQIDMLYTQLRAKDHDLRRYREERQSRSLPPK